MHHKDPLYPFWLQVREALQEELPREMRVFPFTRTCGEIATRLVERLKTGIPWVAYTTELERLRAELTSLKAPPASAVALPAPDSVSDPSAKVET